MNLSILLKRLLLESDADRVVGEATTTKTSSLKMENNYH